MIYLIAGIAIICIPIIDVINKHGLTDDSFEQWLFGLNMSRFVAWRNIIMLGGSLTIFGFYQMFAVWN